MSHKDPETVGRGRGPIQETETDTDQETDAEAGGKDDRTAGPAATGLGQDTEGGTQSVGTAAASRSVDVSQIVRNIVLKYCL